MTARRGVATGRSGTAAFRVATTAIGYPNPDKG